MRRDEVGKGPGEDGWLLAGAVASLVMAAAAVPFVIGAMVWPAASGSLFGPRVPAGFGPCGHGHQPSGIGIRLFVTPVPLPALVAMYRLSFRGRPIELPVRGTGHPA